MRYPIRFTVDNRSGDVTTQLSWQSARQMRQIVPAGALFAEGAAANLGAGLNTVLFATTTASSGDVEPDFTNPLASGPVPDLSVGAGAGRPGATGSSQVDVLADPGDPVAAAPPPPAVVSPRRGAHDVEAIPQVSLTVLGGVRGGSVHAQVQGTSIDVSLPFDANGNLVSGAVPVGSYGAQTLLLSQRTYAGATCGSTRPGACAESAPVAWDVVVDAQTPVSPAPPVISAPRDPTSSPDPVENVFQVSGHGTPPTVQACDQGGVGAAGVISDSLHVDADGNISGSVVLTSGTAVDPNPGWHKLSLSQDGCTTTSKPVFISVGVRPPTVQFPRSSGAVDCSAGGVLTQLTARGTLPYSPSIFGPLIIAEELGHLALGLIPAQISVDPTPAADGSFGFQAVIPVGLLAGLPFGKHLLYFFQAPPPPPNATQAEIDAHYRAFASIATTPTSRIEVPLPPLPLTLPASIDPLRPLIAAAAPILSVAGCALQLSAGCAQPRADVNVRDGARLWTTRASDAGDWQITLGDLAPGWHQLTLGQVVDSPAGGGWVESCPSPSLPVGITSAAGLGPTLALPAGLILDATSAAGALLGYDASATTATGTSVAVDCHPPPGAPAPIGVSNVLCTAVDPATRAVSLGTFPVTVTDSPPVLNVPSDIVAEADSALGALVSYDVTAVDAVDGPLPVECSPAAAPGAPALFPLNQVTTVTCTATDRAHQTTTRTFAVQVRDTVAPVLCGLSDVSALATSELGAPLAFPTCANDQVDGAVAVTCDHAPGSTFPFGTTLVTCTATDRSGNQSQGSFHAQITVSWSNFLSPIDVLNLVSFLRLLPVTVQFQLTGPSAGITDLAARLFVAPVDSQGNVGPERPASGGGGIGNLFRFVPLLGRYQLSLSTSGLGPGVWQLRVDLGDGGLHTARIRLL